jgi:hypothetical protein
MKTKDILTLVNNDFLREKVVDGWNVATGDAYQMEKNLNEILMFSHFVERGLALPATEFSQTTPLLWHQAHSYESKWYLPHLYLRPFL